MSYKDAKYKGEIKRLYEVISHRLPNTKKEDIYNIIKKNLLLQNKEVSLEDIKAVISTWDAI